MKAVVLAWLLAVVTLPALSQSNGAVTLVNSPDVGSVLSVKRLSHCLRMIAREIKQENRRLPNIVVFQVSKRTAEAAYVMKDVAVRHNKASLEAGQEYYEVWLVGDPKLNYVLAFENVLEDYYQLQLSDQQRDEALRHVALIEDATVDVAHGK